MSEQIHEDYLDPIERCARLAEIRASHLESGSLDDPGDQKVQMIRANQALALRDLAEDLRLEKDFFLRPTKEMPVDVDNETLF